MKIGKNPAIAGMIFQIRFNRNNVTENGVNSNEIMRHKEDIDKDE